MSAGGKHPGGRGFRFARLVLCALACWAGAPAAAGGPAGLGAPSSVRIEPEGRTLPLIGAHVRTSFFRSITLFALYAGEPAASFEALIASRAPKIVTVTVLRPEFTAERFRSGWREQFAAALGEGQLESLAPEIEQFVDAFETLRRGEQLAFEFVPGEGVRLRVKGVLRRAIAGDAFAAALLGVWLGPRSVDPDLRRGLLGALAQPRTDGKYYRICAKWPELGR